MAVWLNMKGRDASLCASMAEGIDKITGMLKIRREQGALITPTRPSTVQLDVHYIVSSVEHGSEEFWLSDDPESTT
jgi:hypothetical protein